MGGKRHRTLTDTAADEILLPMTYDAWRSGRAYWLSVLIGSYVGIILQMIVTTWGEPIDRSELWALPVLILIYGLLALPFVALGLAVFGLPVTRLLRRKAQDWRVGILAALWAL